MWGGGEKDQWRQTEEELKAVAASLMRANDKIEAGEKERQISLQEKYVLAVGGPQYYQRFVTSYTVSYQK